VAWTGSAEQLRAESGDSWYRLATSDDTAALELAADRPGLRITRADGGDLVVLADEPGLDTYMVALGSAGIAVRRLELLVSPLESMFFALTADGDAVPGAVQQLAARVVSADA
jgi:ABC-2 type transport system ATP-binding protein